MTAYPCVAIRFTEEEKTRLDEATTFIKELRSVIAKAGAAPSYVEWLDTAVGVLHDIRDGYIE